MIRNEQYQSEEIQFAVESSLQADIHRVQQRYKQICFGYVSLGYYNYRSMEPVLNSSSPSTPRPEENLSKRKWDAKVANWRVFLHQYDDKESTVGYSVRSDWTEVSFPKIRNAQRFLIMNDIHPFLKQSREEREPSLEPIQTATHCLVESLSSCIEEPFHFDIKTLSSCESPFFLSSYQRYTPTTFFAISDEANESSREGLNTFDPTPVGV